MHDNKFDPKKLNKLNNPKRLLDIPVNVIWDKLGLSGKEVFVEIGAGTAFFSIAFLEHGGAEKLYACDVSEVMIDWMSKNVVPQHPAIVPIQTTEDSVPLKNGIANLVFMINLHHELSDPVQTLHEAFRLTKVGGQVLVIDWKKKEMTEGPPTHIRCLNDQVEEQLAAAGFHDIYSFNEFEKHFVVIGTKG